MGNHLTKTDWVRHGLQTLAKDGANALKVGLMSTKLKVSRGSFYWHFQDISDFRSQVLQSWQESTTDQVIQELEAEGARPSRLKHLMRRGFQARLSLDRAIRSWAAQDGEVATIVASVDARRVAYIANLLVATGLESQKALDRAAFVYWAYLGQAMVMDPRYASIAAASLDDIAELLEQ